MQPPRRIPRIAIVGGGPGGLFTAHELQRLADRPVATTILEASGRLGGKISTPTFESSGTRYEAGAAEFYDYEHFGHDPLKDLVRELGLRIRPMGGPAVLVDDAVVANLDDLRDRLGAEAAAALLAFDTTARDRMTPREFYAAGDPGEATTAAAPRPFGGCPRPSGCSWRSWPRSSHPSSAAWRTTPRTGLRETSSAI
jgi:phytoene dehydrogenase-like protein